MRRYRFISAACSALCALLITAPAVFLPALAPTPAVAAATIWTPDQLPNLEFWFEVSTPPTGTNSAANSAAYTDAGTTLATDGQAVQQWSDRGPYGYNATQSTSGYRPTYVAASNLNSLPALRFTATSLQNLSLGNPSRLNTVMKNSGRTYAIVFSTTANLANRTLFAKHAGSGEQPVFLYTADNSLYDGFVTTSKNGKIGSQYFGNLAGTSSYVAVVRETPYYNSATNSTFYWVDMRINGRQCTSRLMNKTTWADSANWHIGSTDAATPALPADGDISALIGYSRALTDEQTLQLESYLSRYGVYQNVDNSPVRTPRVKVSCAGDSITAGSYSKGSDWPSIAQAKYTDWDSLYINWGIPGQNTNIASIYPSREVLTFDPTMVNIAVIWLGTNDLANVANQQGATWTRLQTLIASAKSAGYKVITATPISRGATVNGQFEGDRQALRTSILAGAVAAGADLVVDLGSSTAITINGKSIDVSVLGAPTAYSNTTYFHTDSTHLTAVGEEVVAQAMGAAVNYLVQQSVSRSLTSADVTLVAGGILTNTAYKIAADVNNRVASNVQQIAGQTVNAAAAVTFPATVSSYAGADPAGVITLLQRIPGVIQPQTGDGYAQSVTNGTAIAALPTASANATAVWAAGTRSLTDKAGFTLASGEYIAIANAILTAAADGTITVKQALALNVALSGGKYVQGALNTNTHQRTTTYYRSDGVTSIAVSVQQYASDNTTLQSRTVTFSNLP